MQPSSLGTPTLLALTRGTRLARITHVPRVHTWTRRSSRVLGSHPLAHCSSASRAPVVATRSPTVRVPVNSAAPRGPALTRVPAPSGAPSPFASFASDVRVRFAPPGRRGQQFPPSFWPFWGGAHLLSLSPTSAFPSTCARLTLRGAACGGEQCAGAAEWAAAVGGTVYYDRSARMNLIIGPNDRGHNFLPPHDGWTAGTPVSIIKWNLVRGGGAGEPLGVQAPSCDEGYNKSGPRPKVVEYGQQRYGISTRTSGKVQCCNTAGTVCIREDDNGCITGDAGRSSAHSVTWFEAVDLCNVRGMRLCTKEEVLSQLCCRKGCWYDSLLTWTSSTIPSRRTASAYRCPSTVNVSVSTVCAALPSDVQCWVTWADVCGASPPHEPPK
eukprot:gene56922-biopygen27203